MNVLTSLHESCAGRSVETIASDVVNLASLPIGSKGIILSTKEVCPLEFEVFFPQLKEIYQLQATSLQFSP